nr:MAG TPA: hypothetical protein [Crassvirales sp.]
MLNIMLSVSSSVLHLLYCYLSKGGVLSLAECVWQT